MKNTKEITTGAMLLAIYGALLLIDRQFSFFLIEIIALAVPILIIMFGNLYNLKDGIYFSFAILIIALIISPNPYSYFYIPVGIIIGNVYNFMLSKGIRSKLILISIMLLFGIFDLCYVFIISPLFIGVGFESLVTEAGELIKGMLSIFPFELNIDSNKFSFVIAFASLLLTSVMEGLIVHLLVAVLFKRFKINKASFNIKGALDLKPIPAYILLAGSALEFLSFRIENNIVTAIMFTIGSVCMYVLIYYGYVFLVMFLRIRFNNRSPFLAILIVFLLFPFSLILLLIIGFLYGAGPLKKYLVPRQGVQQ